MPPDDLPPRPTYAEVNLTRLAENLAAIRRKVTPAKVMPVVKANGYGHGLVRVAQLLETQGAAALAVAILEEGVALRQAGINLPVLVMGGLQPGQVGAYLRHNLTLTAASVENLADIEQTAQQMNTTAQVHLKIDTGMGRMGALYTEAEPVLAYSLGLRHTAITGIYSHFANAEAEHLGHARLQLERFKGVLEFFDRQGLARPLAHFANSGAVLQLPESYFDMVRPGILFYGVYPSKEAQRTVAVRPALTWKARPVLSKILPSHHPVSYGSTWQSDHPVRILTLPLGYGDGYFRALSNKACVLVKGVRRPLVGRVCMDQILVNLEHDEAGVAEEAVLLGEQGGQEITADELADLAGTIPYEILTNISARVPRVYIEEE
jgi:alanine racemase